MQYESLKDKIEKQAREAQYVEFERLWNAAVAAGTAAGAAEVPTPMHIPGYRPVVDGLCGFAWVVLVDGRCSLARWLVRHKKARKEYGGGVCMYWVFEYNQSHARKCAFARAFASVWREAGFDVYATDRLD
jgi:hypothetical protein